MSLHSNRLLPSLSPGAVRPSSRHRNDGGRHRAFGPAYPLSGRPIFLPGFLFCHWAFESIN